MLCIGVFTWASKLQNIRLIVHCDNQSVRDMINEGLVSGCKKSMYLLKLLTLNNLIHNRRIFVKYIESKRNDRADVLSRLRFDEFFRLSKLKEIQIRQDPSPLPDELWPLSKIWNKN